jgi:MoxR-like ATPase
MSLPRSIQELSELLADQKYLADQGLATALFLALQMGRPLLLEGSPGVGKTEVAKALAGAFGKRLIRLQCYEGIDVSQALYEWDSERQRLPPPDRFPYQTNYSRAVFSSSARC